VKILIAFLACWTAALAIWNGYLVLMLNQPWRGGAADFVRTALLMGTPLGIAVPLVHLPAFKWLNRRVGASVARPVLVVAASGLLSLPLASWPVFVFGGSLSDVMPAIVRPYGVLYVAFGLLFGAWYAAFQRPVIVH
jgi:hypothetical protein